MHLNPARRRGNILAMIVGAPTFHEAHPNRAHLGELVYRLKSIKHRLCQKLGELLVVEDLQRTTRTYFTNGAWMEVVVVVAKARLYEYCGLRQALRVNLTGHVLQM